MWVDRNSTPLALFLFSDPFSIRGLFQYPNFLSFKKKKVWAIMKRVKLGPFSAVSVILNKLPKSYQLVSI